MLPPFHSGLQAWEPGDFILANDKVAIVIEDVGPSDNYDPWGGRPVGIARVENGALHEPGNFGEFFIFMGRMSVVTQFVGVVNDGTDGEPAVVRAQGRPAGTPFLENLLGQALSRDFSRIPTAIDYELAPGAEHVDVYLTHTNYNDYDSTRRHACTASCTARACRCSWWATASTPRRPPPCWPSTTTSPRAGPTASPTRTCAS
jgi:hypothetical protein